MLLFVLVVGIFLQGNLVDEMVYKQTFDSEAKCEAFPVSDEGLATLMDLKQTVQLVTGAKPDDVELKLKCVPDGELKVDAK